MKRRRQSDKNRKKKDKRVKRRRLTKLEDRRKKSLTNYRIIMSNLFLNPGMSLNDLKNMEFDDIRKEFLQRLKNYERENLLPTIYRTERPIYEITNFNIKNLKIPYLDIKIIDNFEDLCKVIFSHENIFCESYKTNFIKLVRRYWKKKDLEEMLKRFTNKDEKVPKLYMRQIDILLYKLAGIGLDYKKREIEQENINNMKNKIFVKLCNFIIPEELMLIIFSYLIQNKNYLKNISTVSVSFYLLSLMGWQRIKVNHLNIYAIPLLVLRNAKKIYVSTHNLFKEHFIHLVKNTQKVEFLNFYNGKKEKYFFNHINKKEIVKYNITCLKVCDLSGLKIKRKFLPNVKNIKFVGFLYSKNKIIKEYKLEKETKNFLDDIESITICKQNPKFKPFLYVKQIPSFLLKLKKLKSLFIEAWGMYGEWWKPIVNLKGLLNFGISDDDGYYLKSLCHLKFKVENFYLTSNTISIFSRCKYNQDTERLYSSYFTIVNNLTFCKNIFLDLKIYIRKSKVFTLDNYASKLCKWLSNYEFINGKYIGNGRFKYQFRLNTL